MAATKTKQRKTKTSKSARAKADTATKQKAAKPAPRTTKQAQVLELLSRPKGATTAQLMDATGWLAHTVRAALTGLRKRGHEIERKKGKDGVSVYVIAGKPTVRSSGTK